MMYLVITLLIVAIVVQIIFCIGSYLVIRDLISRLDDMYYDSTLLGAYIKHLAEKDKEDNNNDTQ